MMFFEQGGWMVSTPILIGEEGMTKKALQCPHPGYQETQRGVDKDESGQDVEIITERCVRCPIVRFRYRAKQKGQEIFGQKFVEEPSPIERWYEFGPLRMMVRFFQPAKDSPPAFTVHSFAGGFEHSSMVATEAWSFALAGLEEIQDMRRLLRMGPERYIEFRSFKEVRRKSEEQVSIKDRVATLWPIVNAVGDPVLAQAEARFEADIPREVETMDEAQAREFEREAEKLEQEAAHLRRLREEARKK